MSLVMRSMSWPLNCVLGWVEFVFGIAFTIICSAQFYLVVGKLVCTRTRLVYVVEPVTCNCDGYILCCLLIDMCEPTIFTELTLHVQMQQGGNMSQQHSLSSLPELLCVHVQSTTSMSASSDCPSIQVQICHFIAEYRFWMVFGVLVTSPLNAIPSVEVNLKSSRSQSDLLTDWSGCSHPYI